MKRIFTLFLCLSSMMAISAQSLLGDWTGQLRVGSASLTLVLHLTAEADGSVKATLDSPDQGAKDIPTVVGHLADDSLSLRIPIIMASYEGRIEADSICGTFSQRGQRLPLTFHKGTDALRRPQTPTLPLPYPTEEVTFPNADRGFSLSGTLSLPAGMETSDVPCLILVTGSGQQNRDEELFGHRPFFVLADYLARHGIATLRYDDRGIGASAGIDVKNATTADFASDAHAAIEFLKANYSFRSIGILGHSEGASIAFMLGAKGEADFIVSLAGVGVKGDTALTTQAHRIMQLQGDDSNLSTAEYRQRVQGVHSPWIDYFIDYDPTNDLRSIACPVFALQGERDVQVVADLNLPAIEKNLPVHKKHKFKRYALLNHLFQHATTGLPDEYRRTEETISTEVLADIAEWINSL